MCVCIYKAPLRPMPLTCEFFKRLHSRHTDLISNLLEDFKIFFMQRCSSFKYILVLIVFLNIYVYIVKLFL